MTTNLANFTDVLGDDDEIENSQPLSLPSTLDFSQKTQERQRPVEFLSSKPIRPPKRTGQHGDFRSIEEIDPKYREVFSYPYFNLVQSGVIEDAIYSDKSMVVCAPTGSGKTVVFEMAIVQLLMELEDRNHNGDFKIIYMAPVKALCSERLSEWYPKFTKLGLMCIEVTGDTNVDFSQLKPYRIIITTPEKWDMLTRRWRDHRGLVEMIKLILIDEVHMLNDEVRGPVLEAVVSRMKTIETSSQSAHRIERLQKQYQEDQRTILAEDTLPPRIRFVAVSATISNPEDVAAWLGSDDKPAVYYKFGDECRPVKLKRVVEGYPCSDGMSIFKFDIILNYKLWPIIQKHYDGKPTLIFCNTRKSVALTAETLSRELTVSFTPEQKAKLSALASTIKNKKLQALVLNGVGCHHAGLLYEERLNIEKAFRLRDLPILITTTTLAMGVNLPAHLVIIKNTQQYVNGAYQEYSISTVLQMIGRAGRPQFDTEATAVIMTRLTDKPRYQALVGGSEPLQSYLHKRLAENLNSEAALGTVCDVAQCVQWLRSTFLNVRATKEPKRYLGLQNNAPVALITKKIEELCVKAMNMLASAGLITMDEASCIQCTEAGRLMSIFYLDLETMKQIMKINGNESLERLLWIICESHELADMHLRVDERRTLNTLNRNNAAATIRFPMKGKINTRQMKLNCIIQAILGCLPITDPSLNQEAMKVMRIADRVCKCLVAYVTRPDIITTQPQYFSAVLNAINLAKCIHAHLWENSPYVSKQLKGIGPTFSTLLATAGKVNFTLLDESHPRDLERIMNKGPPAGNVLRKQVGLLPKYQLTATPKDEKTVNVQLMLLNHHYLTENRDNPTAGDSHKCYVIVGDSENHLLLFASFMERDLINVFDGIINYEIRRKHSFEHKILIHCVSASWVGIDVQIEYSFKNLGPSFLRGEVINTTPIQDTPHKKTCQKQTTITDVYKERKRKSNDVDVTQSKEKKKRDNALIEKFKHLKSSFAITSKEMKDDLDKSVAMSDQIIDEINQPRNNNFPENLETFGRTNQDDSCFKIPAESEILKHADNFMESRPAKEYPPMDVPNFDDEYMEDERIDSILSEIENEMQKGRSSNVSSATSKSVEPMGNRYDGTVTSSVTESKTNRNECGRCDGKVQSSFFDVQPIQKNTLNMKIQTLNKRRTKLDIDKSLNDKRRPKSAGIKSNFSFIDVVNNKQNSPENDDVPQKDNGFGNAIKQQIERFLQNTNKNGDKSDTPLKELINYTDATDKLSDHKVEEIVEENISLSLELPAVDILNEKVNNVKTDKHLESEKEHQDGLDIEDKLKTKNPSVLVEITEIQRERASEKNNNDDVICVDDVDEDKQRHKPENSKLRANSDKTKCFEVNSKSEKCEVEAITSNESEEQHIILQQTKIAVAKPDTQYNVAKNSLVPFSKPARPKKQPSDCSDSPKIFSYKHKIPKIAQLFEDASDDSSQETVELNTYGKCTDIQPYEEVSTNKTTNSSFNMPIPLRDEIDDVFNNKNECTGVTNFCLPTMVSNKHVASIEDENKIMNLDNGETQNNSMKQIERQCVNSRSFTATKVNVYTKHTPEHKLQVIRKLQFDLNITEIVSMSDSDNVAKEDTRGFHEIKEEERTYLQETDDTEILPCSDLNYVEDKKGDRSVSDLLSIGNKKVDKSYSDLHIIGHKDIERELENVRNLDHKKDENAITHHSILPVREKSPAKSPYNNNTACNITEKKETVTNAGNNIENILNKYSAILRKNTMSYDYSANMTKDPNVSTQSSMAKKPYKIREIDNLEIPLPKNMIIVTRTSNLNSIETKDPVFVRKTMCDVKNDTAGVNMEDQETAETAMYKKIETQNDIETGINHMNIPESPDSEIPQIDCLEDFDIDQSMLNPKTLLQQCYGKEECDEIILPPPAEFCDDDNMRSPTQFQDYFDDLDIQEFNDDIATGFDHNTNIFEDKDHLVLTPSKEIETWTLSIDDEECNTDSIRSYHANNLDHSLKKSYTVMRQNSPVNENLKIDNFIFNSRRANIGKFKFLHKNKLRH